MLSPPCTVGCRMPDHLFADEQRELEPRSDVRVDVANFPWVSLQYRHPEPGVLLPAKAEQKMPSRAPKVAVCLAGAPRTFVDPSVWANIKLNVLRRDYLATSHQLDLFLVLLTGPEPQGQFGAAPGVHPRLLEAALRALEPIARMRMVTKSSGFACGVGGTGQFRWWDECVKLVLEHETYANHQQQQEEEAATAAADHPISGHKRRLRYDFVLKTRPDVVWQSPLSVHYLASQLDHRTILTGNDVHVLAPRATWSVFQTLRPERLRCVTACEPASRDASLDPGEGKPSLFPGPEYCLMAYTFATAGVRHLEASHPNEMVHLMLRTTDTVGIPSCAQGLRYAVDWHFMRFDQPRHWLTRALSDPNGLIACDPEALRAFDGKTCPRWPDSDFWLSRLEEAEHDPKVAGPLSWLVDHSLLGGVLCRRQPRAGANEAYGEGSGGAFECLSCTPSAEAAVRAAMASKDASDHAESKHLYSILSNHSSSHFKCPPLLTIPTPGPAPYAAPPFSSTPLQARGDGHAEPPQIRPDEDVRQKQQHARWHAIKALAGPEAPIADAEAICLRKMAAEGSPRREVGGARAGGKAPGEAGGATEAVAGKGGQHQDEDENNENRPDLSECVEVLLDEQPLATPDSQLLRRDLPQDPLFPRPFLLQLAKREHQEQQ